MHPAPSNNQRPAPPRHIAIIMDGNGRWAKARGLPRFAGHQRGADSVREVVQSCRELGVSYLTLYAFSSENWKRPMSEIEDLMGLLRRHLQAEIADMHKERIRLLVIGERERLPPDIARLITEAEARTAAALLSSARRADPALEEEIRRWIAAHG